MTTLASLLVLLALAPPEAAPGARPDLPPRLRKADEVLADYARAIGGEEAWSHHKTLHVKLSIEVKGMQFAGTHERYATAAGQMLDVMEISGVMSARQGTDGKVSWSEDPIYGVRILAGAEEEEARIDSAWNADLHLARLYQKVRSVPPPEAAGSAWSSPPNSASPPPPASTPRPTCARCKRGSAPPPRARLPTGRWPATGARSRA